MSGSSIIITFCCFFSSNSEDHNASWCQTSSSQYTTATWWQIIEALVIERRRLCFQGLNIFVNNLSIDSVHVAYRCSLNIPVLFFTSLDTSNFHVHVEWNDPVFVLPAFNCLIWLNYNNWNFLLCKWIKFVCTVHHVLSACSIPT